MSLTPTAAHATDERVPRSIAVKIHGGPQRASSVCDMTAGCPAKAERPPRFRRLSAENVKQASNVAPQIKKPVAVEVCHFRVGQAKGGVDHAAGGCLESMKTRVRAVGGVHVGLDWTLTRDCQERPAVRTTAPPVRGSDCGVKLFRVILTPRPEQATVFARDGIDEDSIRRRGFSRPKAEGILAVEA